MTVSSHHGSRPDTWSMPKAHSDPVTRRRIYGRVRPMAEDLGLLQRLFGRP